MRQKSALTRNEISEIIKFQCECLYQKLAFKIDESLRLWATRKSSGRLTDDVAKHRGPKDTKMMKVQRTALVIYVTVELHKNIIEVTRADAYHVWKQPENVEAWNEAAKRKDTRRGYKNHVTLYGVVKTLAEKKRLNLAKITAE